MLADYGKIVPDALLEMAPHGALNLHPSLAATSPGSDTHPGRHRGR